MSNFFDQFDDPGGGGVAAGGNFFDQFDEAAEPQADPPSARHEEPGLGQALRNAGLSMTTGIAPIDAGLSAVSTLSGLAPDDVKTMAASGAAKGVGHTLYGAGEMEARMRAIHQIPARVIARTAFDADIPDPENAWRGMAETVTAYGETLRGELSEAGKQAVENSTPTGDITDPSSWSLGKDPSVAGYVLQTAEVMGQIAPMLLGGLLGGGSGAGVVTSSLLASAQGGGAAASEEGQRVRQMKPADLEQVPLYQQMVAAGMDPAQAREDVAKAAEYMAFNVTAPVSALSGLILGGPMTEPGQAILAKALGPSVLSRIAAGVALEAPAEGAQEVAELVAQRLGGRLATGEQITQGVLTEGSFGEALLGAIGGAGGAVAGGGANPGPDGAQVEAEDWARRRGLPDRLGPAYSANADVQDAEMAFRGQPLQAPEAWANAELSERPPPLHPFERDLGTRAGEPVSTLADDWRADPRLGDLADATTEPGVHTRAHGRGTVVPPAQTADYEGGIDVPGRTLRLEEMTPGAAGLRAEDMPVEEIEAAPPPFPPDAAAPSELTSAEAGIEEIEAAPPPFAEPIDEAQELEADQITMAGDAPQRRDGPAPTSLETLDRVLGRHQPRPRPTYDPTPEEAATISDENQAALDYEIGNLKRRQAIESGSLDLPGMLQAWQAEVADPARHFAGMSDLEATIRNAADRRVREQIRGAQSDSEIDAAIAQLDALAKAGVAGLRGEDIGILARARRGELEMEAVSREAETGNVDALQKKLDMLLRAIGTASAAHRRDSDTTGEADRRIREDQRLQRLQAEYNRTGEQLDAAKRAAAKQSPGPAQQSGGSAKQSPAPAAAPVVQAPPAQPDAPVEEGIPTGNLPAAESQPETTAPAAPPPFTPTHELADGTPVAETPEPGVWLDANGTEIEDESAKPIRATETASETPAEVSETAPARAGATYSDPRTRGTVKPEDDLLTAMAKLGGLSQDEARSEGIDPAEWEPQPNRVQTTDKRTGRTKWVNRPKRNTHWGIYNAFTKDGRSAEDMIIALHEAGFDQFAPGQQNYDRTQLIDAIQEAVGGTPVMQPRYLGSDAYVEQMLEQRAEQEADDYGAANQVFTADGAVAARERLRKKLGRLNAGVDPEMLADGIYLAGYHLEAGVRRFTDWVRRMHADLGDAGLPYFRQWYEAARWEPRLPQAVKDDMTPAAEIGEDVAALVQGAAPEPQPTSTGQIDAFGTNETQQTDIEDAPASGIAVPTRDASSGNEEDARLDAWDRYVEQQIDAEKRRLRDARRAKNLHGQRVSERKLRELRRDAFSTPDGWPPSGGMLTLDPAPSDTEVLGYFDAPNGVRIDVAKISDGYSVRIYDTESGETIGSSVQIFRDDLSAKAWASRKAVEAYPPGERSPEGAEKYGLAWPPQMVTVDLAPIDAAAHEAATSPRNDLPDPTDAQKEAGNYQKGHVSVQGLDISIENPAGSRRNPDWPVLKHHYGYFKGTVARDKDHVDVFLGPDAETTKVAFVVDQVNPDTGLFDEHKVMLGFPNKTAAREAYLANYEDGWKGMGAITPVPMEVFKEWVADPNRTRLPVARDKVRVTKPKEIGDGTTADLGGAGPAALGEVPADADRGTEGRGRVRQPSEPPGAGRGEGDGRVGAGARSGRSVGDRAPGSDADPGVSRSRVANYAITADDKVGQGGLKTKYRQNVEAIRLLKALEAEGRAPTPDEQRTLVRYVGWGGMPQAFTRPNGTVAKGWEREAAELAEVLTDAEYRDARASTQNAHYTAPEVITGIYDALARLGYAGGGRALEPSMGAGWFIGLQPEGMRAGTRWTGVELDSITGRIAAQLYPKANVQAGKGFEEITVPEGHFDIVVGNPPFGNEKIHDPKHPELGKFSIHNYFIAKAVHGTRPGGVVAVVVSNYFLDAKNPRARVHIARSADLLGAIRLPNTAFQGNANTEVTTDIVFLRRRMDGEKGDSAWTQVGTVPDPDGGEAIPLNRYFIDHPEMLLGEMARRGTMYGRGQPALVPREGANMAADLAGAIERLPAGAYVSGARPDSAVVEQETAPATAIENARINGMFVGEDGSLMVRLPDVLGQTQAEPARKWVESNKEYTDFSPTEVARITSALSVSRALDELIRGERDPAATTEGLAALRRALNERYDAYAKKYGLFSGAGFKPLMRDDPAYPRLLALEDNYDAGVTAARAKKLGTQARKPSAKKAAIFSRRVFTPHSTPKHAGSASEAMVISMNHRGSVDMDWMQDLTGLDEAQIADDLAETIYYTPEGEWVSVDEWTSGNVKAKLAAATAAAKRNDGSEDQRRWRQRALKAIEDVQPEDLTAADIEVRVGSPWVPGDVMADFAIHLFGDGTKANIAYHAGQGLWAVDIKPGDRVAASTQWGTDRRSGEEIFEKILNHRPQRVTKKVDDKVVTDKEATLAASQKADEIKAAFVEWIYADATRRQRLEAIYNERFNTDRMRTYDGSHLTLPGKVPDEIVSLRPHQKDVVWRMIQKGRGLLDHVVGAGKTFAVIATAMEQKRLGLHQKPMIVVPNHLVEQWAADWYKLYPNANLLVATKRDFAKHNRRKFFARIATGEYDAIIVAHSSFQFIKMPPGEYEAYIREEVDSLAEAMQLLDQEAGDKRTVKQLEKRKDNLEAKLQKHLDDARKDDVMDFGEMGVDAIYVDEAHAYKNLQIATKHSQIAGLGNLDGSQKATDLYVKARYVMRMNGGRGVFFATGTPVSNSLAEMFTMLRYLNWQGLDQRAITHFDAWSDQFADQETGFAIDSTGAGFKQQTRFSKFVNMPELQQMYREVADVITLPDLKAMAEAEGKRWPTPKIKGGKPENVVLEPGPDLERYITDVIIPRAEAVEGRKVDPSEDNMLAITNDARKAALDMRLIDPLAEDYEDAKVNVAAGRIFDIYQSWAAKKGTQLVFMDLSIPAKARAKEAERIRKLQEEAQSDDPKVASKAQEKLANVTMDEMMAVEAKFSVYDDLKAKLVAKGVPETQIAFIHDANTDKRKQDLFDRVNAGDVRVLIGSTAKMGAGMNVQKKLVALHHMDAPWRPSDLEQREGRIIRQGNEFYEADPDGFEVEIVRYATARTYDSRMWQLIEGKALVVDQARQFDPSMRTLEDVGGQAAQAAELKALASGNPLIMEQVELSAEVKRLQMLESNYRRQRYDMENRLANLERDGGPVARVQPQLDALDRMIELRDANPLTKEEGQEAAKALTSTLAANAKALAAGEGFPVTLGTMAGFDIVASPSLSGWAEIELVADAGSISSPNQLEIAKSSGSGLVQRVKNLLDGLPAMRANREKAAKQSERDIVSLREQLEAPFRYADDLARKKKRLDEVMRELAKDDASSQPDDQATDDDSPSFSRAVPAPQGFKPAPMTAQSVRKAIASVRLSWNGAPPVRVVERQADLPAAALQQLRGGEAVFGVFVNGTVYLVADNLTNAAHARAVLAHEVIGHFTLPEIVGDQWNDVVERMRALIDSGNERVTALVQEVIEAEGEQAGDRVIAEEVLARIAERRMNEGPFQAIWRSLRQAIRRFLKRVGLAGVWADADLDLLVSAAVHRIENGPGVFNRRVDDPAMRFMRVYHGTPHTWKPEPGFPHGRPRYDASTMLTGEGHQAYGAGFYVAENKAIGARYRRNLSSHLRKPQIVLLDGSPLLADPEAADYDSVEGMVHLMVLAHGGNIAEALGSLRVSLTGIPAHATRAREQYEGAINYLETHGDHLSLSDPEEPGNLYGMEVPDEAVAQMLDWDRLMKDQPAAVREALKEAIDVSPEVEATDWNSGSTPARLARYLDATMQMTGKDMYLALANAYGSREMASAALLAVGIPGIKYLDAGSRGQGKTDGTRNFVLFRPQDHATNVARFARAPRAGTPDYQRRNDHVREEDRTLVQKARRFLRRNFGAGGLLPSDVFQEKIQRDSNFELVEFEVRHLVGRFEQAVNAAYGRKFARLDADTQALLNRGLRGDIDPAVPADVRESLYAMRELIDNLSRGYMDILFTQAAEMIATGDPRAQAKARLFETIAGNLGTYVHRSYQAFDDPQWFKKVPDAVLNRARDYLIARHVDEGLSRAEAIRRAEVTIHELLKSGTAYDSFESYIKESKLGAKDLTVLIRRKQIAPEIRALLGEHVDPRLNFARSATKMGRLIFNQHFLDNLRAQGMGVYLFEGQNRPPEATAQIASQGSEVLEPLNGLWTFPDVAQAFEDALGKHRDPAWLNTIIQLNGAVKFGKTVLSPTTAMRNFMSAALFTMANGHFDWSHMSRSLQGWREYFSQQGQGERLDYLRRLKQLGVIYDTPYAGEMMRLLDDVTERNGRLASIRGGETVSEGLEWAQKFYQFGDDFWKILGWENERRMLMRAGMPEAEADREAAARIRNTYPTYSMVGRAMNFLRRFPLAGTFVSFPSEIIRTSYHMLRYTYEDMRAGRTEMAARRVAGLAIASALPFALQALTMAWMGLDDDDEDALRRLGAPWNENSNIFFWGYDDQGRIEFFDMSYMDPYNQWKRPLVAMLRNEPWEDRMKAAARDFFSPFFGTDIAAGAIFEVMANKKESGGRVFNPNDMPDQQLKDIASHLAMAVAPGVATNTYKTLKAMNGDVRSSGQPYDVGDEVAAWFGFRRTTLDPKVALYYKSFEFADRKRDASAIFNRSARDPNSVSDDELRNAYRRATTTMARAYRDIITLVQSARKMGASKTQVIQTLRAAGVSKRDIGAILAGKAPPFQPSRGTELNAIRRAEALFPAGARQDIARRFQVGREAVGQ